MWRTPPAAKPGACQLVSTVPACTTHYKPLFADTISTCFVTQVDAICKASGHWIMPQNPARQCATTSCATPCASCSCQKMGHSLNRDFTLDAQHKSLWSGNAVPCCQFPGAQPCQPDLATVAHSVNKLIVIQRDCAPALRVKRSVNHGCSFHECRQPHELDEAAAVGPVRVKAAEGSLEAVLVQAEACTAPQRMRQERT
jgi:hypothetical protein